jgi:hypothetical protein
LNVAPTNVHPEIILNVDDYGWKAAIKKAEPFLTSRSLNVLKKSEKGLLTGYQRSFFWGRYLPQQA